MKKTFLLKGLDCPNCSAKIEKAVEKLDGVNSSEINLIKQTLTVDIKASALESIKNNVEKTVHIYESDVEVSEYKPQTKRQDTNHKKTIFRLILGAVIYILGIILGEVLKYPLSLELSLLIISYIILGADVVIRAMRNIIKGHIFDENFLMTLSTVGAFIIGEYPEAVAVMLFYQIGEFFQDMAVEHSKKSISDLMDIRPDTARVNRNGEYTLVPPETVRVGEFILIKPGEKIALDGIVTEGTSMLDTKALTGESVPKSVHAGDAVLSGCINESSVLTVRVTKEFGESTVAKIIDLVENASSKKAPTENFITTFARCYTPAVVILAASLAILPPLILGSGWAEWIHRGFVFLVISCPCALVISIPLTFFGGIGAASKHGVLVKGSNYLEALNNISTVVFDKTGTLTKGVFKVKEIIPQGSFTSNDVLKFAAMAESFSNHLIAKSVFLAYGEKISKETLKDYKEISGKGIRVCAEGRCVLAGNSKLMEAENISFIPCHKIGTKVYVAVDRQYIGCIVISDEIKEDSKDAIAALKDMGVKKTVMLTGDNKEIAKGVAEDLGLDEYYAELLPYEKVEKLELLDSKKPTMTKLAFVGDGINDAPVLARADVGIAMGGLGSDAAIEAADVVIMTDEVSKLNEAIKIAKATKQIVIQNIVFSLAVKGMFLILGAVGVAGMWEAVFGDVGVALLAVLNAMRILKK